MNSTEYNRYLIAVLFPSYVNEGIIKHKHMIAMRYGSKAGLYVIPHFTLKTPMSLPNHIHNNLIKWFRSMPISVSAFQQEMNGFGAFYNKEKPVIYAKPVNVSRLKRLQKEIIYQFRNNARRNYLHPFDTAFTPHATIAYRDLSLPAFQQAWTEEYKSKEYYAAFNVTSLHLLQHNGKYWQSISEFHLPSNNNLIEESQLALKRSKTNPTVTTLTLF